MSTLIPNDVARHIYQQPDNRWSFYDETGDVVPVSYGSFEDAAAGLNEYSWFILEGLGRRLQVEELVVTFQKSDGTVRTMRCTSNPSAFPTREVTERTKIANPHIQVVVDLDKNAVRSFRRDSVISVN